MDAFNRKDETLAAMESNLETLYSLFEAKNLTAQDCQYLVQRIDALNHAIAERINAGSLARSEMYLLGSWEKKAA